MIKHMKLIFILCILGISMLVFLIYSSLNWVMFPTKSVPHTMTLSRYTYLCANKITLKHYVNDIHIRNYVLELKVGMGVQGIQSYNLPQLSEGSVEVIVELNDELNSSITMKYNHAQNLYEKGLLIYFTDNNSEYFIVDGKSLYDRYVYFVSNNIKICYYREAFASNWEIIDDAPPLKIFAKEQMGHFPCANEWKNNHWVIE